MEEYGTTAGMVVCGAAVVAVRAVAEAVKPRHWYERTGGIWSDCYWLDMYSYTAVFASTEKVLYTIQLLMCIVSYRILLGVS